VDHWLQYLGKSGADYEFGDLTKKVLADLTGEEAYEFGDITRTVAKRLFGPRKRSRSDSERDCE
jgi:hypothetical protein